jgi:putative membrane protein
MIRNFADHAANERTFLAWIRTALAIIAFGFVIERFDYSILSESVSSVRPHGAGMGTLVGILSVALGSSMVLLSMIRFIRAARRIDSEDERRNPGIRYEGILAALLMIVGVVSLLYLSHAVSSLR